MLVFSLHCISDDDFRNVLCFGKVLSGADTAWNLTFDFSLH